MKLNQLKDNPGARKARKRVGRGIGSGCGKTSGSGHKGQKARSGVSINGFEGGQNPLYRRLPKRGFNNIFRRQFDELNLGRLQAAIDKGILASEKKISLSDLKAAGIVRKSSEGVRLLSNGTLKTKVDLEVTHASALAKAAVEKVEGKLTITE
jgi:large subunit ribosomal protein L15